ncbi:MAG: hypothetical protein EBZ67_05030 [Chitinophagia bacterium]|nr:hypothetical protein [Chitinophagia bacterium]
MSPEEVMEKMKQAKIYIDFGSHPGRDRFPREAAFCGCCIITGNKGSAENDFDIMIPSKYKFKQNSCDLKDIKKMIQEIFDNFIDHYPKFETYRNIISNEKKTFEHELDEVINEVQ